VPNGCPFSVRHCLTDDINYENRTDKESRMSLRLGTCLTDDTKHVNRKDKVDRSRPDAHCDLTVFVRSAPPLSRVAEAGIRQSCWSSCRRTLVEQGVRHSIFCRQTSSVKVSPRQHNFQIDLHSSLPEAYPYWTFLRRQIRPNFMLCGPVPRRMLPTHWRCRVATCDMAPIVTLW
jgi:hypothetical protein